MAQLISVEDEVTGTGVLAHPLIFGVTEREGMAAILKGGATSTQVIVRSRLAETIFARRAPRAIPDLRNPASPQPGFLTGDQLNFGA